MKKMAIVLVMATNKLINKVFLKLCIERKRERKSNKKHMMIRGEFLSLFLFKAFF